MLRAVLIAVLIASVGATMPVDTPCTTPDMTQCAYTLAIGLTDVTGNTLAQDTAMITANFDVYWSICQAQAQSCAGIVQQVSPAVVVSQDAWISDVIDRILYGYTLDAATRASFVAAYGSYFTMNGFTAATRSAVACGIKDGFSGSYDMTAIASALYQCTPPPAPVAAPVPVSPPQTPPATACDDPLLALRLWILLSGASSETLPSNVAASFGPLAGVYTSAYVAASGNATQKCGAGLLAVKQSVAQNALFAVTVAPTFVARASYLLSLADVDPRFAADVQDAIAQIQNAWPSLLASDPAPYDTIASQLVCALPVNETLLAERSRFVFGCASYPYAPEAALSTVGGAPATVTAVNTSALCDPTLETRQRLWIVTTYASSSFAHIPYGKVTPTVFSAFSALYDAVGRNCTAFMYAAPSVLAPSVAYPFVVPPEYASGLISTVYLYWFGDTPSAHAFSDPLMTTIASNLTSNGGDFGYYTRQACAMLDGIGTLPTVYGSVDYPTLLGALWGCGPIDAGVVLPTPTPTPVPDSVICNSDGRVFQWLYAFAADTAASLDTVRSVWNATNAMFTAAQNPTTMCISLLQTVAGNYRQFGNATTLDARDYAQHVIDRAWFVANGGTAPASRDLFTSDIVDMISALAFPSAQARATAVCNILTYPNSLTPTANATALMCTLLTCTAQPVAAPIAVPVAQPVAAPVAVPVAQPVAMPVAAPSFPDLSAYCFPNGIVLMAFFWTLPTGIPGYQYYPQPAEMAYWLTAPYNGLCSQYGQPIVFSVAYGAAQAMSNQAWCFQFLSNLGQPTDNVAILYCSQQLLSTTRAAFACAMVPHNAQSVSIVVNNCFATATPPVAAPVAAPVASPIAAPVAAPVATPVAAPVAPPAVCGNGIVEAGEQCDAGIGQNGQCSSGCSASCQNAPICVDCSGGASVTLVCGGAWTDVTAASLLGACAPTIIAQVRVDPMFDAWVEYNQTAGRVYVRPTKGACVNATIYVPLGNISTWLDPSCRAASYCSAVATPNHVTSAQLPRDLAPPVLTVQTNVSTLPSVLRVCDALPSSADVTTVITDDCTRTPFLDYMQAFVNCSGNCAQCGGTFQQRWQGIDACGKRSANVLTRNVTIVNPYVPSLFNNTIPNVCVWPPNNHIIALHNLTGALDTLTWVSQEQRAACGAQRPIVTLPNGPCAVVVPPRDRYGRVDRARGRADFDDADANVGVQCLVSNGTVYVVASKGADGRARVYNVTVVLTTPCGTRATALVQVTVPKCTSPACRALSCNNATTLFVNVTSSAPVRGALLAVDDVNVGNALFSMPFPIGEATNLSQYSPFNATTGGLSRSAVVVQLSNALNAASMDAASIVLLIAGIIILVTIVVGGVYLCLFTEPAKPKRR